VFSKIRDSDLSANRIEFRSVEHCLLSLEVASRSTTSDIFHPFAIPILIEIEQREIIRPVLQSRTCEIAATDLTSVLQSSSSIASRMEHRRKADLSILARDPFDKANFGVLARHAVPEPAVNAPLLAKKEAIPPMMRARDRYGVDEAAQWLSRLEADARLLKNINYENVKRITVDTDHYAPTVRRSQLQYAVKPFPTLSVGQDELFAKKIASLEALSVKDGVWDDQPRYGLDDPPPESFRETFDHPNQDVGQSQNNTKGSNQVTLRGNVQRNLGSKDRHASQRTSDGSPEARASFTVKKHADGVPYLARRDAAKTALESAAVIMNSKAPQAPAESGECGMYITHTISEDRTGTADEVMTKRLAALTGERHQTNKAKKKPRRKNAWGEVERESSIISFPCALCNESFTSEDALKVSTYIAA
jgi:hypothetical protein